MNVFVLFKKHVEPVGLSVTNNCLPVNTILTGRLVPSAYEGLSLHVSYKNSTHTYYIDHPDGLDITVDCIISTTRESIEQHFNQQLSCVS